MNILLDLDGCCSDFFTAALNKLNLVTGKNITIPQYVSYNTFDMEKVWEISNQEFWNILENDDPHFWENLSPYPHYKDLYDYLCKFGEVTIATTPSKNDETCPSQKIKWVKKYLGLDAHSMMIGSKKYLMANPSTILVDDYYKNIEKFHKAHGLTCQLRSNWNSLNFNFDMVKEDLNKVFSNYVR